RDAHPHHERPPRLRTRRRSLVGGARGGVIGPGEHEEGLRRIPRPAETAAAAARLTPAPAARKPQRAREPPSTLEMRTTMTHATTAADLAKAPATGLRIGTAPDSWGVWFPDHPRQVPWQRFLDEVQAAGYHWIEL